MVATDELSQLEQAAARMFFNVSVQSAFALEDPNMRFVLEFQHEGARQDGQAKTMEAVINKRYETEIAGGTAVFETNPPNTPALSRVIVTGANITRVIESVLTGLKAAEYFEPVEQKPLERVGNPPEDIDLGNRMVRLVVSDKVVATHDVAALFSWRTSSDKGSELEMMAWPINKTSEF